MKVDEDMDGNLTYNKVDPMNQFDGLRDLTEHYPGVYKCTLFAQVYLSTESPTNTVPPKDWQFKMKLQKIHLFDLED